VSSQSNSASHAANGPIAAFVLAGGKSSRMGRDKALLELDGETLIERTVRLAAAVAQPVKVIGPVERFAPYTFDVVEDDWPAAGPLGGIATALRTTIAEWNLILACDLPYLTPDWLAYLAERARKSSADAVAPVSDHGSEPLCAFYRKSCEPAARTAVAAGHLKVREFIADLKNGGRVESVEPAEWKRFDSSGHLFKNMNEPADYEAARAQRSGPAKS
jgi:molybdenum cofactor guanylyltransferase